MHREVGVRPLIERYGPGFQAVARRLLGDPFLVEDSTQQAMLAAWRYLPQFAKPDQPPARRSAMYRCEVADIGQGVA